jgi:hypothetical protein
MSDGSELLSAGDRSLALEGMRVRIRRRVTSTHRVYIGLGLLIALIAVVGFGPRYFGPLVLGIVDKPAIIHVHAAIFSGWVALFITQIALAATGRIDQHRKLGAIGIYYGFVLIAVGLTTGFIQFAARVDTGKIAQAQTFVLAPFTDMIVFSSFFGAAVAYRRRPEIHKRLMLVATTTLLVAAVARMNFLGYSFVRELRLLIWISPLLIALGYDYYSRRIVHPVYVIGTVTLIVLNQRRFFAPTDVWHSVTNWMATFVTHGEAALGRFPL